MGLKRIVARTAGFFYLRSLLRRIDRLGAQLIRSNDIAETRLRLELLQAGITPEQLEAATKELAAQAAAQAQEAQEPAGRRPGAAMELLTQTPAELAELDRAYQEAERHYGRGQVPDSLDLYSYAETLKPDNPDEEA